MGLLGQRLWAALEYQNKGFIAHWLLKMVMLFLDPKFQILFAFTTTFGEEEKLSTDPPGSGVTLESLVHIGQVI